ncbi:LptF/LptG family permease [Fodinibius sediminis]|uniref:Lipopolysaccharide export system permease protein n=1 Tax=Fodinibius sediminis TaxID=1214077 RepID=A0A521BUF7_9BACT|nr:LptF/LptG family permease [Fodinibius sediminis]SMO50715.1 lipopolysaccharide export system permease protein [Fodinibius sediminis]
MRLLPNKLQLDVLKRHVGPFVFCFFTLMFLLLMQFLILYIDMLVGKGLPMGIIIELIITNLASMVVLAVPMAVLVSCLMAFGKITELNELAALKAAGVNPIHLVNPVLVVGVLLSVFLVWFSNDVLPDANQRARSLFIDIRLKKPGFDLKPGEFYDGIDGYTFLVKDMTNESDSLRDVTIYQQPNNNRKEAFIKAQKGHLESQNQGQTMTLFLEDGSILRYLDRRKDGKKITVLEETAFDRYRISFDLSDLSFSRSNPQDRSRNDRTMNIQAMQALVDSLNREVADHKQLVLDNTNYFVPTTDKIPEQSSTARRFSSQVDSLATPSYSSQYIVLNSLDSESQQRTLHDITLAKLRSYQSLLEEVTTDTEWRINKIARYMVEIHKKFAIPMACIIFVLLGAPIGMFTRRGNLGYAALIGAVFLTFYWISIIQGEKLADRMFISPATGMWYSNVILGLIGLYLVIRISTSFKFSNLWRNSD